MTHAQRTGSITAIEGSLNVVLEKARSTVVGETLAEFDNSNQEGCFGNLVAHASESLLLLLGGDVAAEAIVLLCYRGAVGRSIERGSLLVSTQRCDFWLFGQWLSSDVSLLVGEIGLVKDLVQAVGLSMAHPSESSSRATYVAASVSYAVAMLKRLIKAKPTARL